MKVKIKAFLGAIEALIFIVFVFSTEIAFGATYNVPADGSLPSVCNRAGDGDVINIAAGSYWDEGECWIAQGVKVIGAGKDKTSINTSIVAKSAPGSDGRNEISGIKFQGSRVYSSGRDNQKIHDNSFEGSGYEGLLVEGKRPGNYEWDGKRCNGEVPSESAVYCENEPTADHYPEEGDWADGLEIYNNDLTDTNMKLNVVRGSKIHHNNIDNTASGISGVGHTSFWWNNVDFYNNTILMDEISWTHIAMEVWKISNNSKFRDNYTNGWFSLLENAKGESNPYSWQITGNIFAGNSRRGDVNEALETSYSSANVLIADNYFENVGSNNTYETGIAIWGTGPVKNYTIRNNVFYNIDGSGITIQSTDNTRPFTFQGEDFKIFNNTFDKISGVGVFIRGEGPGNIRSVQIKNNVFNDMNYAVLVGYGNHNVRNAIEFTNNMFSNLKYIYGATDGIYDYISGDPAFSSISNNYKSDPELKWTGERPNPFYVPSSDSSNVVDKGVNVGIPFRGGTPDLGAFEAGGYVETCVHLEFTSGSASPATTGNGGKYNISCNYGVPNLDSVRAKNDLGPCAFSTWSGNSAIFTCQSGSVGTRTNSCETVIDTTSNSCENHNTINSVIVTSQPSYFTMNDVITLIKSWKKKGANLISDVNRDGIVFTKDLGIMMSKFRKY